MASCATIGGPAAPAWAGDRARAGAALRRAWLGGAAAACLPLALALAWGASRAAASVDIAAHVPALRHSREGASPSPAPTPDARSAQWTPAVAAAESGDGWAGVGAAAARPSGTRRYRGVAGASLYRAARAAGASAGAVQRYLEAIGARVDLADALAPGSAFDFVVAYPPGGGGAGKLLYARLAAADGRAVAELLRFGGEDVLRAAPDAAPAARAAGFGVAPVPGPITSGYGMRFHPLLGYVRMHAGVDIAARYGEPIRAAADARVAYAGWHGGHGLFVQLDHGGGLGTGYAHMSRVAVSAGEAVRAGEVIGYVGSTGLSTGPHLHYEAYRDGRTVDPLGFQFASAPRAVAPGELAAWRRRLAAIRAIAPAAAPG